MAEACVCPHRSGYVQQSVAVGRCAFDRDKSLG
uniref:Uncharacterized protein n=1 Tax=Myoviridae sp. cteBs22 TaxID=2826675 RepID=A0A8S5R0D3_9CAUD|nr:MAG TPA: hypothetical protein [Myoviridae sp. cteBs22]